MGVYRNAVGSSRVGGCRNRVSGNRARVESGLKGYSRVSGAVVMTSRHRMWLSGLIGRQRGSRVGNRRVRGRGGTC